MNKIQPRHPERVTRPAAGRARTAGEPGRLAPERLPMLARVLKAIAHPLRLSILELVVAGDRTVGDLATLLAAPQAVVSQQLQIMRDAGVIAVRRVGTRRIQSLALPGLRQLLQCLIASQHGCPTHPTTMPAAEPPTSNPPAAPPHPSEPASPPGSGAPTPRPSTPHRPVPIRNRAARLTRRKSR